MSKIALEGNSLGSGTFTIAAPNSNSNPTLTLPTSSGTVVVTGGAQTIEFAAGTAASPSITFTGDTNTGIFSPGADTIAFSEGGAEAMRIDSSGNVGIGTTTPTSTYGARLNCVAPATVAALALDAPSGTNTSINWYYNGSIKWATQVLTTGEYRWYDFTASAERMRIDSSGNVGIGVSSIASPSASRRALQVSNSTSGGVIYLSNDTTESNNPRIFGAGSTQYDLGFAAGSSTGFINWYTNGTERARITSGGELCVGTTAINATWTTPLALSKNSGTTKWAVGPWVGGENSFIISTSATGGVFLNGTAATSWSANSDERLKENLVLIENAAEKICSLRAVTGNYIEDEEKTSHAFLIAQDVQAVLPQAVAETTRPDGTKVLGLAYTETIPLLVAAIQELKAITDAQATRIEALEAEVAALKGQ